METKIVRSATNDSGRFLAKADQLGMTPEEAKAAFKAMDTDGDGKVSFDEFQVAMGVSPEDVKRRLLKKYGNADKAVCLRVGEGGGRGSGICGRG